MNLSYPIYIKDVINKFYENELEAYVVGGALRNILLGKEPMDWDICTSATPEETMEIFKDFKVIPTGIKHGTVTVLIQGEPIEITTYRTEGEYLDGRRPSSVGFVRDLKEDLVRRDFTINAMAYNHIEGLKDYNNGLSDLSKQIIRSVGDPNRRFQEDYLRMLRCVRFATQLGFDIDLDTYNGIKENKVGISIISKERIRVELEKIILSKGAKRGFEILADTGLLEEIMPELHECIGFEQHSPYHDKDVFGHLLDTLDYTQGDIVLRLSALFHDIGKPKCFSLDDDGVGHFYGHQIISGDMTKEILTNLRFDNKTIDMVCRLVREHMVDHCEYSDKALKRLINRVGLDNLSRLFDLKIADKKGSVDGRILEIRDRCQRIINEKQPLNVNDLKITGHDIIKLGIKPGKEIGRILEELLQIVLECPEKNDAEILKSEANSVIENIWVFEQKKRTQ